MIKTKYKFLEHTADVKFQAYGSSLKEAFINSAMALKETMFGKIKVKNKKKKFFNVESRDKEGMLYLFLEEFLFLLDAEDFIFSKIKIKVFQDTRLEVEVWGDSARNYPFTNDVKAVTYNQMFVKKIGNKFVCQVVLDV